LKGDGGEVRRNDNKKIINILHFSPTPPPLFLKKTSSESSAMEVHCTEKNLETREEWRERNSLKILGYIDCSLIITLDWNWGDICNG